MPPRIAKRVRQRRADHGKVSHTGMARVPYYGRSQSLPCVMAQACPIGAIHREGGVKTAGFDGGIVTAPRSIALIFSVDNPSGFAFGKSSSPCTGEPSRTDHGKVSHVDRDGLPRFAEQTSQ